MGGMAGARVRRRLAAILAADLEGFSRLTEVDEAGRSAGSRHCWRTVVDPAVATHPGAWSAKGDGMLAEFRSAVEALACAVALRKALLEREAAMPAERRIRFRIGINLGDVALARAAWAETLRLEPAFSLERRRRILPFRDPADFELRIEGLRKAGIAV